MILAGANGSSVTLTIDLISRSVDLSALGIDWNGNYTLSGNDVLGAALDIAGIFDPTGATDIINARIQFEGGAYFSSLLCAVSAFPGGDIAKVGRIGKDVNTITGVIGDFSKVTRFTRRNFRRNLAKLTGEMPAGMQAHHIFPQKHRSSFENAGLNIDDLKYGAWLETKLHLQKARVYNKAWEGFFKNHPNATMEEILEQAEILMKEIYGQ